ELMYSRIVFTTQFTNTHEERAMFFSGTTHVVSDLEQSRKFYEDLLGFEPDVFYAPTCWQSYRVQAGVFFGIGQPPGSTPAATFDVADIEALWARVQDHPGVVEPLNRTPWGSVRFVIRDPDGNLLAFKAAEALQP